MLLICCYSDVTYRQIWVMQLTLVAICIVLLCGTFKLLPHMLR